MIVTDREARIERFNRAAEQVSGFAAADMIGRSLIDALMPPESVRGGAGRARGRAMPAEFPRHYEHGLLTADGGRRLVSWAVTCLVDDAGAITHLVATGTDVTEQRRAAEALRISTDWLEGILEHTTTRIAVKDDEGRYLLVNRAWREANGVDGTGRTDAELFAPEVAERGAPDRRGGVERGPRGRVRARRSAHRPRSWSSSRCATTRARSTPSARSRRTSPSATARWPRRARRPRPSRTSSPT